MPGFLAFVVLRQGLQAEGRTRGILLTVLVANLANVGLNWVLIFGHLGVAPLGPIGSAWATVASRTLLPLLLLAFEWPHLRGQLLPRRPDLLASGPLLAMLRIGVPIGFQHQLEYGVFGVVGLLMDTLGAAQMAGHQIALNLASLTFMVPLGIGSAAAVLVGQAVGAGDRKRAGQSASAAIILALGFMSSTAAVFLSAPAWLAGLYTNDRRAAAVAVLLIPLAGIFQVFDGLQVVSIGALRGLADTRTPMIANIMGFWVLGLPIGLWLAFRVGLGAVGLWWGLVIGLVAVGLTLVGPAGLAAGAAACHGCRWRSPFHDFHFLAAGSSSCLSRSIAFASSSRPFGGSKGATPSRTSTGPAAPRFPSRWPRRSPTTCCITTPTRIGPTRPAKRPTRCWLARGRRWPIS